MELWGGVMLVVRVCLSLTLLVGGSSGADRRIMSPAVAAAAAIGNSVESLCQNSLLFKFGSSYSSSSEQIRNMYIVIRRTCRGCSFTIYTIFCTVNVRWVLSITLGWVGAMAWRVLTPASAGWRSGSREFNFNNNNFPATEAANSPNRTNTTIIHYRGRMSWGREMESVVCSCSARDRRDTSLRGSK